MKMGKKVREYKAGDFIFAKVKGYPAWPARVQRPNGKKYFVYFYGTGETANLAPTMIFDYAENKDKFLSKAVKRRDFNDGVKQIEHDFANNVPLEQVIGVAMEVPEEVANDTANDSAPNDTMDESAADITAADDTTAADESTANETAKEGAVEEPEESSSPAIDEGKQKGRKTPKPGAKETPAKPAKEPRTPRGKKKDDGGEEAKDDDAGKKEEEIVSRSGRKIRPKRYIDEQTEENSTLPSPAPKKRRGASPSADKEKDGDKADKTDPKTKPVKQFNTVSQAELEDLKEPFNVEDTEKENILIAYLPSGQYVGIKLFQSRPTSFKNEAVRLQWDKQQAINAVTLKTQLEKGHITAQSVLAQLVMDLHLTDEEKATLDKERETEEKRARVQFLKTEMKLIELDAKIKTCLCLERADTDLCLTLLDEFMELEVKPLMLLKHPASLETIKRMRAYVGNTPSWDLSETAALLFNKQAHMIRKQADALYKAMKGLFEVPKGLSFWEFFSERVVQFKKVTANMQPDDLLELVHEPLGMSVPTSHTMKAAIDAVNEEEESLEDDMPTRKKAAAAAKSKNNATPKPSLKRQSSRKQQEEKEKEKEKETEKEKEKEQNTEQNQAEDAIGNATDKAAKTAEAENTNKDNELATEETPNANEETNATEDKTDDSTKKDDEQEKPVEKEREKAKEKPKSKSPSPNGKTEVKNTKDRENKSHKDVKGKEDKAGKDEKSVKEKPAKEDKSKEEKNVKEDKEEQKEKDDEPRAKRSRESKKTDGPPPRSPAKRKTKS